MATKYLSRWTLPELTQYARDHRPIFIMRDPRTGRINRQSYYEAVRRDIRRNMPIQMRKQTLARLVERVQRENVLLPEDCSGRGGRLIKKKRLYHCD